MKEFSISSGCLSSTAQDDTQEYHWHHIPKWPSASWAMHFFTHIFNVIGLWHFEDCHLSSSYKGPHPHFVDYNYLLKHNAPFTVKLFQIQMTRHPLGSKSWVFLRHVIQFWNTVHPEIPDCSANFFVVQCLSPSIHCPVMVTDMAVWKDWTLPLWCMSEVNILPILNVHIHLGTVQYGCRLSLSASCDCVWHFHTFLLYRIAIFINEHCSILWLSFMNVTKHNICS